jgi:hypothetical protein
MSEEQALLFLRAVRENQSVHELVVSRQDELTLDDLVAIGAELGWHFDADDLHQAFRHEWTMRWLHLRARKRMTANEA